MLVHDPNNSNLYSNRALFLAQLGDDIEATKDLDLSLKINPRNYIAYFNLFSIQTRNKEDFSAF